MRTAVPVDSPCINVCEVDTASGICRGCRRTIDEIASWGLYTPAQRLAIMTKLEHRPAPRKTNNPRTLGDNDGF